MRDLCARDACGRMMRIETERLVVRDLSPDDAPAMCAMNADPQVMRDMPGPGDNSVEAERGRIARYVEKAYGRDGFGLWAVEEKDGGAFVGRCGLLRQEVEGLMEVELTYQIRSECWGRGYAKEAARAIVTFAFGALGLDRVIALVPPEYEPSAKVAAGAGLARERSVQLAGRRFEVYAVEAPDSGDFGVSGFPH